MRGMTCAILGRCLPSDASLLMHAMRRTPESRTLNGQTFWHFVAQDDKLDPKYIRDLLSIKPGQPYTSDVGRQALREAWALGVR